MQTTKGLDIGENSDWQIEVCNFEFSAKSIV